MTTPSLDQLKIKLFADGADLESMTALATKPHIAGFTTNPSLLKKAGVLDYPGFARQALAAIPGKPISFEVFADDFATMEREAHEIASWGEQVYVKVPAINTEGRSAGELIRRLSAEGIKLNVTAIFTIPETRRVVEALDPATPAVVSVFAGRVADTGRDPIPMMQECLEICRAKPEAELLWASTRELFNIFEADRLGCHIITVPHSILQQLGNIGRDLDEVARDGVKAFVRDAAAAGLSVSLPTAA